MNQIETVLSDALDTFDGIEDLSGPDGDVDHCDKEEPEPTGGHVMTHSFKPLSSSIPIYNNGNNKNSTTVNAKAAELTADGRRKWKKPEGRPKRPLSAYNFFFIYERGMIVSGNENYNNAQIQANLVDIILRKTMDPKFANANKGKRRKHRKSHGKISFRNLAITIADKWKTIDEETRFIFEKHANRDKIRYNKEVKVWKEKMEEENNKKRNNNTLSSTHIAEQHETNPPKKAHQISSSSDVFCLRPSSSSDSLNDNFPSFSPKDLEHILCPISYRNNCFCPYSSDANAMQQKKTIFQPSFEISRPDDVHGPHFATSANNKNNCTMPISIISNSSRAEEKVADQDAMNYFLEDYIHCREEARPIQDELACFMEAFERE